MCERYSVHRATAPMNSCERFPQECWHLQTFSLLAPWQMNEKDIGRASRKRERCTSQLPRSQEVTDTDSYRADSAKKNSRLLSRLEPHRGCYVFQVRLDCEPVVFAICSRSSGWTTPRHTRSTQPHRCCVESYPSLELIQRLPISQPTRVLRPWQCSPRPSDKHLRSRAPSSPRGHGQRPGMRRNMQGAATRGAFVSLWRVAACGAPVCFIDRPTARVKHRCHALRAGVLRAPVF